MLIFQIFVLWIYLLQKAFLKTIKTYVKTLKKMYANLNANDDWDDEDAQVQVRAYY